MHNSTWRIKLDPSMQADAPELKTLLKGWHLHMETDRLFHNSAFFQQHTEAIRQHLNPVLSRTPFRPFFIAHVSLELLLDHLLIREEQVDTTIFYKELEQCQPELLESFFQMAGIQSPESFYPFYRNFCEIKYVKDYAKLNTLAYAINQIGKRVWKVPFNDQEQVALSQILEDYIHQIPDYQIIFSSIESDLDPDVLL